MDFINLAIPQSKLYYNRADNSSLMALGNIVTGHLWVGFICTVLGGLACLACLWKYPGDLDRVYCLGISSALILSPISWIPYGILMFPPLIILSTKTNWKSIGQSCLFVLLFLILFFWPLPIRLKIEETLLFHYVSIPRLLSYLVFFFWSLTVD